MTDTAEDRRTRRLRELLEQARVQRRHIFARELAAVLDTEGDRCQANKSLDPPQDCNWPHCQCDPQADRVIAALIEESACFNSQHAMAEAMADDAIGIAERAATDGDQPTPQASFMRETPDAFLQWFNEKASVDAQAFKYKQIAWEAWSSATLRCDDLRLAALRRPIP